VPDRSAKSVGGFIESAVAPGTTIITDNWSGYAGLTKRNYLHTAVPERGDMQVAETFLPIIHLVFSKLKTWLRGIHHGVSPQHLQAYLNEFTFRFNRRFYLFNASRSLLGNAGDVTAPTIPSFMPKNHNPLHLANLGASPISTRAIMAVALVNRTLALRATPQFALDRQGASIHGSGGGGRGAGGSGPPARYQAVIEVQSTPFSNAAAAR